MADKKLIRRKPYNKFRFYPLFQRRESKKLENGDYINNYKNVGLYPCDRKTIGNFEASILEARQIVSDVRLDGRYPHFKYINGDRFLFLDNFYRDGSFAFDDLLYLSHFQDRTGRKEYGEFLCSSDEFTTISKQGFTSPKLFAKSEVLPPIEEGTTAEGYGDLDLLFIGKGQRLIKDVTEADTIPLTLPSHQTNYGVVRAYDPNTHLITFDRNLGQRLTMLIMDDNNFGFYELEVLNANLFVYRVQRDVFTLNYPEQDFPSGGTVTMSLEDENFEPLSFQPELFLTFFEPVAQVTGKAIVGEAEVTFTKLSDRQFLTSSSTELIEIDISL